MSSLTRRNVLHAGVAVAIPMCVSGYSQSRAETTQQSAADDETKCIDQSSNPPAAGEPIKIQYLEIVTPEIDGLCRQYSTIHDITFSEPHAHFGGARTANLDGGGRIRIRGPVRSTETTVVRPYMLVDDIKAAVDAAAKAGAEIAMGPTPIPGHGMFAIVIHGGIDCGFWQN